MHRIKAKNLNTPEYWERFKGEQYHRLVRLTGLRRYKSIVGMINDTSEILEVGCNSGDFLSYLFEQKINFKRYVGSDFCEVAIAKAKKNYPQKDWFLCDCHSIPVENNTFDIIIAMQLLEHIDGIESFLSNMKELLKPKGKLILTVPNQNKLSHESHHWKFDLSDIVNLLSEAGFANIDVRIFSKNTTLVGIGIKK